MGKVIPFAAQILFGALFLLAVPDDCLATGDAVAGRNKAQPCLTCHRKGNVVLGEKTPIISGQYQDYLMKSLSDYRSGVRKHQVMNELSANLSDKDIEDISAYYSGLNSRLSDSTHENN